MYWRASFVARNLFPTLVLGGFVAGCGGGGGAGSNGEPGADHTTEVGIASISYHGDIVPSAVFSQSGVTVTTMAGATFSNVQLNPTPTKENSVMVYSMGSQIWTYRNGVQSQITHEFKSYGDPVASKNGLVVFDGYDSILHNFQLFSCNLDGSNLRQLTSSAARNHTNPSFSPSGSKIVCTDGSNLYSLNSDGSGESELVITNPTYAQGTAREPAWSPDGSRILFTGVDNGLNHRTMYVMPSGGGAATRLLNFLDDFLSPHWSPDGHTVTFQVQSEADLDFMNIDDSTGFLGFSPPSGSTYTFPSFTPDGGSVVFVESNSSASSIDTQLIGAPSSVTPLVSYPSNEFPTTPSWSPFFGPKSFVGPGGEMSAAAGFIWEQLGDGFGSFASISATTPALMTITQQNPATSNGPFVFLAKADKLTKIVYANSYFGAYNAITPANSKQALISVSSSTGLIYTVAPLAEPGLRRSSRGGLAYDGKFTAIYDGHGKNLAPSGASHIELDPKSGGVKFWQ